MLRTIKAVLGYTIQATDKNLGSVQDFYFDDHRWIIRYLIANTGNWLPGRHVLLGTEALGKPDWKEEIFPVNLTTQQIEDSPDIQDDAPVSIQQEEKLRAYFSWQRYWGETPFIQPAAGATFGFVGVTAPPEAVPTAVEEDLHVPTGDPHLRSLEEVCQYSIQAYDGKIGQVEDFIVDDLTWRLHYMIVDTGNWLSGNKVLISPEWIKAMNWSDQTVTVDMTQDGVKHSPEFDPSVPINREYETRLYDYYGRPHYWTED